MGIERLTDKAKWLLQVLSHFAAEPIPRSILNALIEDGIDRNASVEQLRTFSFIDLSAEFVSVHRMLALVVRNSIQFELPQLLEDAFDALDSTFPFEKDKPSTWKRSESFLAHCFWLVEQSETNEVRLASLSHTLNNAGLFLSHKGQSKEAKQLFKKAIVINEAAYQANHPKLAISYNNLGHVEQALQNRAASE